ncbi:MAG TPA: hypothetical protein VLL52_25790 [Anaerolineae bacterium]|nr:hypothetical protein [Anaerolineae bacterium]
MRCYCYLLLLLLVVGCGNNKEQVAVAVTQSAHSSLASVPIAVGTAEPFVSELGRLPAAAPANSRLLPATIDEAVPNWRLWPSLKNVTSFAFQTDDKLWVGSWEGLLLWDLVTGEYERYQVGKRPLTTAVRQVAADGRGRLWVLLADGVLMRLEAGVWAADTGWQIEGDEEVVLLESSGVGTVWLVSNNRLWQNENGRWQDYPGLEVAGANKLVWGADKAIWLGYPTGLVQRFAPEEGLTVFDSRVGLPMPDMPGGHFLGADVAGRPWLYWQYDDVYVWTGAKWEVVFASGGSQIVCDLGWDRERRPWVATCGGWHAYGNGLFHFVDGAWQAEIIGTEAEATDLSRLVLSPNGSVAVLSETGLVARTAKGAWQLLQDGPAEKYPRTALLADDGRLWLGFERGTWPPRERGISVWDGESWQFQPGNSTHFTEGPDGRVWSIWNCRVAYWAEGWQEVNDDCDRLLGRVLASAWTDDGAVWLATGMNLTRFDGERWERFDWLANNVAVVGNTVWAVGWTGRQGESWLRRWEDGEMVEWPIGLMDLAATADGWVWGLMDGQLWRWQTDWEGRELVRDGEGMQLQSLHSDGEGGMWLVAAEGGYHWADGAWDLRLDWPWSAEIDGQVSWILGDESGAWLVAPDGLWSWTP